MKTIKEAKEAPSDEACYFHHTDQSIFEWGFESGVEFAQRWIPISAEMPEDGDNIVESGLYSYAEHAVIVQTRNGKYSITKRTRFNSGKWHWSGSASFDKSVISWRPIQRT